MTIRIDRKRVLFSIVTAFFLLLICTKCSPLYPFNDWVDVHCYLTIGRGIKHGLVPYRDLYEQKGPFLYFIVALATFVSERSFVPLFVIECLAFSMFIYQTIKIVFLWTENRIVYVAAPLIYMTIAASSAVIFCGYFAGLAVTAAFWYVSRTQAKEIIRAALWSLAGFAALTVPILIWYAARGGVKDLFQAYFYNNIMFYSDRRNLSAILFQLVDMLFRQNTL